MNKLKHVVFIINPFSGIDVPVLAPIAQAMRDNKIKWDALIIKSEGDVSELTQQAIKLAPDAIAVCGGDGTVLQVASLLYKSSVPLLILPGGTANILAKELGIPLDIPNALKIFKRIPKKKAVDISVFADGTPMFLRVEVGLMASIITGTDRKHKRTTGILSYPVSAIEHIPQAKTSKYSLTIDDGETKVVEGVGLMIANVGNIGIPGISIQKSVKATDGKLDVFVLQSADIGSLVSMGTSTLTGRKKPKTLKHWKATDVKVTMRPKQKVIRDDEAFDTNALHVHMIKEKLTILV